MPTAKRSPRSQQLLKGAERPAILWGEKVLYYAGRRGPGDDGRNIVDKLGVAKTDGAGHLQIPVQANGRGLREIGFLPNLGPALTEEGDGKSSDEIAAALGDEVNALILMGVDPMVDYPERRRVGRRARQRPTVISFSTLARSGTAERHADVVFPLEVGPEKEGTLTHPDGRLQRLRQTVERAGEVNAGWWAIDQLAERVGLDLGVKVVHQVTAQIADGVPIYAGITPRRDRRHRRALAGARGRQESSRAVAHNL